MKLCHKKEGYIVKNIIDEARINKSIEGLKKRQYRIRRTYSDAVEAVSELESLHVAIVGLSFCKKYLKENNQTEIKI